MRMSCYGTVLHHLCRKGLFCKHSTPMEIITVELMEPLNKMECNNALIHYWIISQNIVDKQSVTVADIFIVCRMGKHTMEVSIAYTVIMAQILCQKYSNVCVSCEMRKTQSDWQVECSNTTCKGSWTLQLIAVMVYQTTRKP